MLGAVDAGVDGVAGTGDDVSFTYVDNAQGLTLRRDQMKGSAIDKQHRYLYVNGQSVGDIGNDGDQHLDYAQQLAQPKTDRATQYKNWKPIASADFDQNYQPINSSYPSLSSSSYTVQAGDNLYLIAARVWGDASMWYLLADANGLNAGIALSPGQVLTIPNKVTNVHNSSSTFRPYDAGAIMGDTSPTLPTAPPPPPPPRHKKGCGGLGQILMVIVAVVVTIYTAGAAAAWLAPAGTTIGAGSAAVGIGAASTWSVGVAALSGGLVTGVGAAAVGIGAAGFAAAAIGGTAGSIAGQLTGMATGNVDKFSWGAVAAGALGAAVGSGIAIGGSEPGNLALNAAVRSVATQGINIVTGQQQGFSWASVAASAISAPIANSINNSLFGNVANDGLRYGGSLGIVNQTAKILAESTTSALVSATTRVAIVGGKLDWVAVTADALGSFVNSRIARDGAIQRASQGYMAEQAPAPVRDATPKLVAQEEAQARNAPAETAARRMSVDEFLSGWTPSDDATGTAQTATRKGTSQSAQVRAAAAEADARETANHHKTGGMRFAASEAPQPYHLAGVASAARAPDTTLVSRFDQRFTSADVSRYGVDPESFSGQMTMNLSFAGQTALDAGRALLNGDAAVGAYNLFRHPIDSGIGLANGVVNAVDRYNVALATGDEVGRAEFKFGYAMAGASLVAPEFGPLGDVRVGALWEAKAAYTSATSFYKTAGYETEKISSHVAGIDFHNSVEVITLGGFKSEVQQVDDDA